MRKTSECRAGACRRCPSVSRRAARAADDTSPTTSDSRPCTGYPSGPSRTPPRTRRPRPQHRGSPSPAGKHPRRVAWKCRKALPQTPAPPLSGWPISSAGVSGPFAPPALPDFIATTDPSVPALRIGTRLLAVPPLGGLPWHRSDRFPRSAQKPLAGLTPSSCRSPLGQSAGFLRASSQTNNWSLGFGDVPTLSTRPQRFTRVRLTSAYLTGTPAFSATLTTPAIVPAQLAVV